MGGRSRGSERGGTRVGAPKRAAAFGALALAVGMMAAACSGGEPVGLVGTTLSSMGAQVTLTAVYDPATVSSSSLAQPPYGRDFVATLLTVRNLSGSSVDLRSIYKLALLRDNRRRDHVASPSGTVTQCQRLDSLGQVEPHQSASGCAIFELSVTARPTKLFIKSTPQASWAIAADHIQQEPSGGLAIAPPSAQPPASANAAAPAQAGNTGPAGNGSTAPSGPAPCSGNTGAGNSGAACQGGSGAIPPSVFAIVTTSLPGAATGVAYTDQLIATGGATPYHWRRINGSLPRGIHIGKQGLLFGRTRAAPGVYSFTIQVRDSTPEGHLQAVQNLSLTVS